VVVKEALSFKSPPRTIPALALVTRCGAVPLAPPPLTTCDTPEFLPNTIIFAIYPATHGNTGTKLDVAA